ncbi:MAG: NUDIX hydrolase [Lachnospiraceae bacterium]|nr:NUDIX hydrolase [Lachnospiraceae bacterium]
MNDRGKGTLQRDPNGLTEEEFLAVYQPGDYPKPSVATDMVIFTVTDEEEENYRKLARKELRVLLIKRGGHPYLGSWALPGGFVRPTETTEEAAARELREETGVDKVYLEQLYTFSEPDRDPRTWVMSCSYMALIDSSRVHIQAGDDAAQAAWFQASFRKVEQEDQREVWELTLSHEEILLQAILEKETGRSFTDSRILDFGGLAFDHARILACGYERLRGKLSYTDLALHLMPEYFTLTQLQQVYEVVLDREFPVAAFRRKAAPMVTETESYTENGGHRPSRLYRKNP